MRQEKGAGAGAGAGQLLLLPSTAPRAGSHWSPHSEDAVVEEPEEMDDNEIEGIYSNYWDANSAVRLRTDTLFGLTSLLGTITTQCQCPCQCHHHCHQHYHQYQYHQQLQQLQCRPC
jgi:hypothetical protein